MTMEIHNLKKMMDAELTAAEKYAHCAIKAKEGGNSDASSKFCTMARQELEHCNILHSMVVKVIEQKKLEMNYPDCMAKLYDVVHDEYIEHHARIKQKLSEL